MSSKIKLTKKVHNTLNSHFAESAKRLANRVNEKPIAVFINSKGEETPIYNND